MGPRMHSRSYPIIEVVWVDAEEKGEVGWNDIKELIAYAKKPCPTMRTVGYEIYRDDDHVALLSTVGPAECSTLEKIPIAFVKKINVLSVPGQTSKKQKEK